MDDPAGRGVSSACDEAVDEAREGAFELLFVGAGERAGEGRADSVRETICCFFGVAVLPIEVSRETSKTRDERTEGNALVEA